MISPRTARADELLRQAAVNLVLDGAAVAEAAESLGVGERSVWRWLGRWRSAGGGDALRTAHRCGRPPKLTERQAAEVISWLERSACDFGFATGRWTAPRVASVIRRRFGVGMNARYLNRWLRRRGISPQIPETRPRERDQSVIDAWVAGQWPRIKKKVSDLHARLVFTDESGFMLLPLVRSTLAPIGRTPVLEHRARQRDKVSVAGALCLSPSRGHVSLYCQTYPDAYVDNELYAGFLHVLLRQVPGCLVLVHDGGGMHKGEPLRGLHRRFGRRLDLNVLPPYAPELNPVEYLWNHVKDKELANFAPLDVPHLESQVLRCVEDVRGDQHRLRTFYASSPLPWDGLPGLM